MGFERKLSTAYWVHLHLSYAVYSFVCLTSYICQAANNMDPDRTAEEQSDQGSYCLIQRKDAAWCAFEKQAVDIFRTKENIGGIRVNADVGKVHFFYRSLLFAPDIRLDKIENKFIYTSTCMCPCHTFSTFYNDNCRLLSHLLAIWTQLNQVL